MKKAIITYENLSVSSGYQSYNQYLTSTSTLYYSEKLILTVLSTTFSCSCLKFDIHYSSLHRKRPLEGEDEDACDQPPMANTRAPLPHLQHEKQRRTGENGGKNAQKRGNTLILESKKMARFCQKTMFFSEIFWFK